jgi:hypothetical protein
MRFQVCRASEGSVSQDAPVPGAVRGPVAPVFPGEYVWFLEVTTLEELVAFLDEHGGLVLWSAEEGEGFPVLEIIDEEAGCE